jgi:hypothetical protein
MKKKKKLFSTKAYERTVEISEVGQSVSKFYLLKLTKIDL